MRAACRSRSRSRSEGREGGFRLRLRGGQGHNAWPGLRAFYGGGVKVKITGPWLIRFDFRQFNTGMPFGLGASGRLLQNEISAGVSFTI